MKTKCDETIESEERWREFLGDATADEAWKAIGDVWNLGRSLAHKSIPAKRLLDLFDIGCAIYQQRFDEEWAPF